jgi:uncharacterized protein (DUF1499 family)
MNTTSSFNWPKWLGVLPLVAGLVIAIWALIAPLGVWFGWWDFGRGFAVLRWANAHSLWFAGGCAAIGVIAIILHLLLKTDGVIKTVVIATVSVVFALGAYFVPRSYAPPAGTPPIHDISTDVVNPPQYVDVLPLRADAANTVVYGGSPDMTPEKLAELQTQAYPDIVPKRFTQSQDKVFVAALNVVNQMGWELVTQVPEEGRIEATDTTFWFRFKDDVVIKVSTEGEQTVVNARSLSRVGVGDVGKNAARLREFFRLLEAQLQR